LSQLHYLSSFAEVGVSDLDSSVRWYEEQLGFHRIANYGDAVHMRRAEGQDLLLREAAAPGVILQMATDLDLPEQSVEFRDPDGNALRIFARRRM
jgi:catechol 2,3-dioxygenase-like lactoylglutathione lyase family enzyme